MKFTSVRISCKYVYLGTCYIQKEKIPNEFKN